MYLVQARTVHHASIIWLVCNNVLIRTMNNDNQNGPPTGNPAGHPSIPPQYARYQQQQQESHLAYLLANAAARNQERRLSAAAAYSANGNGGTLLHGTGLGGGYGAGSAFYGSGGASAADDRLALAVALQEERNTNMALVTAAARAQQQQQLAMVLHRQQQQAALQEIQRLAPQSSRAATAGAAFGNNNLKPQRRHPEDDEKNIDSDNEKEVVQNGGLGEDEDDGDQSDSSSSHSSSPQIKQPPQPRGKPEAMAKKLASAVRQQVILEELEAEQLDQENKQKAHALNIDFENKNNEELSKISSVLGKDSVIDSETNTLDVSVSSPISNKTEVSKKKKVAPSKKKKVKKNRTSSSGKKSKDACNRKYNNETTNTLPTMNDPVVPITETEYGKLEALMEQFCRVPLLAEFSRPVALLHPELMNAYNKIVNHPVDLGKVCRRIRRRQYENLRDVRVEIWIIFTNCLKYHSHPSNKDAVPSFVSIALHLRDLFNDLWQEHMLGSDFPPPPSHVGSTGGRSKAQDPLASIRSAMEERERYRKKRLIVSGLSVMAGKCLERAAEALNDLLENGGLVDPLDTQPIWGEGVMLDDDDEGDLEVVLGNFRKLTSSLRDIVANNEELGVDELEENVRKCYTEGDELENMKKSLRIRIKNRMDRFLGQLTVPIHEATCRGVSQSSIWGCMAAAVWARESSKKPFWPALVLGIIAPEDQKEDWHKFLTERNEARLPEKLKSQLLTGKRKAEQAVKRQSLGQADPQSFFLVEFLGTHEFIWVREADIVENFSPSEDPNKKDTMGHRTKKVSRKSLANQLGSKNYANAIEEAQWALEEFELQLQDIGGPVEEEEGDDEHEEEGYSYSVLSQSDDEADGDMDDDVLTSDVIDVDDCNELLASNGLLDFSAAGRKKRAQILKQQKLDMEKKHKTLKAKKARADKAKKAKDVKLMEKEKRQEVRDLEKKRRKRMREREKALKGNPHQTKKRKLSEPAPGRRHLIVSKRERASAIVNGYVNRASKNGEYKPLSLGGDQKWIQSSLIDSTNLSGMALAFRASAGLIPMPKQDTGAPGKTILKPWDTIRLKGKKTSAERCACLQKQIELLETETLLVKASTERRAERLEAVRKEVADSNEVVLEDDKLARENPLKKMKKFHTLGGKKRKGINNAKKNEEKEKFHDVDNSLSGSQAVAE